MLSSGNADPDICVGNLLRTKRYEVPFERLKGLSPRIVDMPKDEADQEMIDDAEWLIETYEPRVDIEEIDIDEAGELVVSVTPKEDDDDEEEEE